MPLAFFNHEGTDRSLLYKESRIIKIMNTKSANIQHLTTEGVESMIKHSETLTLVDFWAP